MTDTEKRKPIRISDIIWYILWILPAGLRVWLGVITGSWLNEAEVYDDVLMIRYAQFSEYFLAGKGKDVMLKELGMPLILQIVKTSRLPYAAFTSLLWVLSAALIARIICQISKNRYAAFFPYLFVLFTPAAFEKLCGTRIYRASLQTPMYIVVFALEVILLLKFLSFRDERLSGKGMLVISILLGILFSLTYFIKEDGMWILAVLLMFLLFWIIAAAIGFRAIRKRKKTGICVLSILLPFLIFFGSILVCKGVNRHYFDVWETNTRTSGQTGRFIEYLYKTGSPDRTNTIWIPKDVIEQVFASSATLSAHPELKEAIYTSPWLEGDIDENPIYGDRFTWIIKDAVFDENIVSTQKEKEDFFRKVNEELAEAFRSGKLSSDKDRIQLIASIGGKNRTELLYVAKMALFNYQHHLLLNDYEIGARIRPIKDNEIYEAACDLTNTDLDPREAGEKLDRRKARIETANRIINGLFALYRVLNLVFCIFGALGLIRAIVLLIRNRKKSLDWTALFCALTGLAMGAVSYVYSYMVMLFCTQFPERFLLAEKMYSVGLISLLVMFIALGISLLFRSTGTPAATDDGALNETK